MSRRRRVAALLLATALALLARGCSKKKAKQAATPTFSCARLQARAEACQPQTLALAKANLEARAWRDSAKHRSERQLKMLAHRLKKKLREKRTAKQCERFKTGGKAFAAQLAVLRRCFGKQGCEAFARCLLLPASAGAQPSASSE